jgi:2-polyprenyl-6-methoxyphenol hydroxylase-like FAD-dependent oxidoreductase
VFVPVVIVGAGHAGLAMSRRLTERSIDHVVLERALGVAAAVDAELARPTPRAPRRR